MAVSTLLIIPPLGYQHHMLGSINSLGTTCGVKPSVKLRLCNGPVKGSRAEICYEIQAVSRPYPDEWGQDSITGSVAKRASRPSGSPSRPRGSYVDGPSSSGERPEP